MVMVVSPLVCSSDVLSLLPMLWAFSSSWAWNLGLGSDSTERGGRAGAGHNPCEGTTCRAHRYPSGSAWGALSQRRGGAQQGPALSQRCLLSLLAALSAPGLLSVTSLLRNSWRQAEMGAPVPGPCQSTLLRKWGGICRAITVPLAWQA